MAKTSISISDHFDKFIASQIASGRYDTASEVIRAGLRLLEEKETEYKLRLSTLQDALIQGEQSGKADSYSLDEINQIVDEAST